MHVLVMGFAPVKDPSAVSRTRAAAQSQTNTGKLQGRTGVGVPISPSTCLPATNHADNKAEKHSMLTLPLT